MRAAVFSPPCFCAPTIRAPPCLVLVEVIPDFSCGMVLDPLPHVQSWSTLCSNRDSPHALLIAFLYAREHGLFLPEEDNYGRGFN